MLDNFLHFTHPAIQTLALVLMVYVLYLGKARFLSLHCGRRTAFAWKRHVSLGTLAMLIMFVGGIGGFVIAQQIWGIMFLNKTHAIAGIIIMALIISGYISGYIIDSKKNCSRILTAFHGINNLILITVAFWAFHTGVGIIQFIGF